MILGGTTGAAHAAKKRECEDKFRVPRVKLLEVPTVTGVRERIQAFRQLHERFGPIFGYGHRALTVHVTGVEMIDGLRAAPAALTRTGSRAHLPAPPGVPPRPGVDAETRRRLEPILDSEHLKSRYTPMVAGATRRALERLVAGPEITVGPAGLGDALAGAALHALIFDHDLRLERLAEFHQVAGNDRADGPGPAEFGDVFATHLQGMLARLSMRALGAEIFAVADGRPPGWWQEQVTGLYLTAWERAREATAAALGRIARDPSVRALFAANSTAYPRERVLREILSLNEVTERIASRTVRVKGYLVRAESVVNIDHGGEGRDPLVDDLVVFVSQVALTELLAQFDITLAATVGDAGPDARLILRPR